MRVYTEVFLKKCQICYVLLKNGPHIASFCMGRGQDKGVVEIFPVLLQPLTFPYIAMYLFLIFIRII